MHLSRQKRKSLRIFFVSPSSYSSAPSISFSFVSSFSTSCFRSIFPPTRSHETFLLTFSYSLLLFRFGDSFLIIIGPCLFLHFPLTELLSPRSLALYVPASSLCTSLCTLFGSVHHNAISVDAYSERCKSLNARWTHRA